MKLFLIDAYALIYRSYYAFIKNPRINSKGLNTSAIFGFTNSLEDVTRRENPTHIAIAFDPKGSTFRHEIYEPYKAQREETPEDIRKSIPIIKELINGNVGLSEQIKMAISQGIPTWERNILIALQLHRQQGALRIEQAVHKMTNDLIRNNSHLLKENATTIAKAVEGGLIDIEALEEANKNILDTTRAVVQIANEAAQARQQNLDKLDGIVKELMEAETGRLVAPAFKMLDSNS